MFILSVTGMKKTKREKNKGNAGVLFLIFIVPLMLMAFLFVESWYFGCAMSIHCHGIRAGEHPVTLHLAIQMCTNL